MFDRILYFRWLRLVNRLISLCIFDIFSILIIVDRNLINVDLFSINGTHCIADIVLMIDVIWLINILNDIIKF
jgi:hypothetical protein